MLPKTSICRASTRDAVCGHGKTFQVYGANCWPRTNPRQDAACSPQLLLSGRAFLPPPFLRSLPTSCHPSCPSCLSCSSRNAFDLNIEMFAQPLMLKRTEENKYLRDADWIGFLLTVGLVLHNFQQNSFRSLASKGFRYSTGGCACVCPLTQKIRTYEVFFANTPGEHHRRHRLADGPLSSLQAPSPSLSSFGAASVMCCSARPASSRAPSVLPEDRIGRNTPEYNIHCLIL